MGNPEGKRSLGRPRCRWEDNIKMDVRDVGSDAGDWIDLAQDRVQSLDYLRTVLNLRVSCVIRLLSIKFVTEINFIIYCKFVACRDCTGLITNKIQVLNFIVSQHSYIQEKQFTCDKNILVLAIIFAN